MSRALELAAERGGRHYRRDLLRIRWPRRRADRFIAKALTMFSGSYEIDESGDLVQGTQLDLEEAAATEQLVLDLEPPNGVGHSYAHANESSCAREDLSDLDLDRARALLAAEEEATPRPVSCRCWRRSGYVVDVDGRRRCLKCAHEVES